MIQDLEDKLFSKYDLLFPMGRNVDLSCSMMNYGVSCDNGWFDIIDNLCACMQNYVDNTFRRVNGKVISPEQIVIVQVKEKYGSLRVYFEGGIWPDVLTPYTVQGMTMLAETLSLKTCERCGVPGELRNDNGVYKTLCNHCYRFWLDSRKQLNLRFQPPNLNIR